jgi:hypothetical protein
MNPAKLFKHEFGMREGCSSLFFGSELLGVSQIPLCGGKFMSHIFLDKSMENIYQ